MDDVLAHLETIWRALLAKAVDGCLELAQLALRQAVAGAAAGAEWLGRLAAKVAATPLWISVPVAVALTGLVACYLLRQRLYDRVLVYHLVWLRRRGYSKHVFEVRRGAVREKVVAMAKPLPLPSRFASIRLYEAVPDWYLVAYDLVNGVAQDVRRYRRDRKAGLQAMGEDLIRHFRQTVSLLNADSELWALFAILDAWDPDFAAARPPLSGETGPRAARRGSRTAQAESATASVDGV